MRKLYIPIFTDPQHSFEQYDKDFSDLGANFIYLVEPCKLRLQSLEAEIE